jgi:hypothetical protein
MIEEQGWMDPDRISMILNIIPHEATRDSLREKVPAQSQCLPPLLTVLNKISSWTWMIDGSAVLSLLVPVAVWVVLACPSCIDVRFEFSRRQFSHSSILLVLLAVDRQEVEEQGTVGEVGRGEEGHHKGIGQRYAAKTSLPTIRYFIHSFIHSFFTLCRP